MCEMSLLNATSVDDKARLQESFDSHKQREKESMQMKKNDKIAASFDPTFVAVTFNLGAILTTPFAEDSQIYYKRKLAIYNFTIHEGHSLNGYCYLWVDAEGVRGYAEIATCLV